MKKVCLLSLCVIALMFVSCSDDDDGGSGNPSSASGEMIIDGESIQLKSGTIIEYGEWDSSYNFDVELFSSKLNSDNMASGFEDDLVSGLYFELFTDNANDLGVGVYQYTDSFSSNSGTFSSADVEVNCTVSTFDCEMEAIINDGTFEVISNGNSYEFVFDVTLSSGESLTGNFSGALYKFDESDFGGRPSNLSETQKFRFLK
ncbi:MAG: hypothetical protein ABR595_06885 [Psychroflexus sp.]